MAITSYFYQLLIHLKKNNLIDTSETKSIFELGEQNWYGDVKLNDLLSTVKIYTHSDIKNELVERLENILDLVELSRNDKPYTYALIRPYTFELAKIFYKTIFNYNNYSAIDLHGTEVSIKFDLNYEYKVEKKHDVVTNIGTSEHIFNQFNVFKTIHDLTKPGGFIFHQLPGQGYYDHGFYNYQPTFFFDLAEANDYSMIGFWMYDNNKKDIVKVHNRKNYEKLFSRDTHPTYYDNIVVLKTSSLSKKKFILPQQYIYSDKVLSDDDLHHVTKSKWSESKK